MSQQGFPQNIIIDVSQLKQYPKKGFNTFGIYCWHAYNSNPKLIELLISDNNKNTNFKSLGIFELEMRDGIQLLPLDYNVLDDINLKNKIKSIKLVIKSAFGENKTYINQVMCYENTIQELNFINESIQSNNNLYLNEDNLPEDLSNSQISNKEKENAINNEIETNNIDKNKNMNKIKDKKLNKEKNNKKDNFENKVKKQYIIDYISETHSKISQPNENNINNKNESIKVEENNLINDSSNNENNEQEENEMEENEENQESNQIIPTSNELQYPYINKYERNSSPNNNNQKKKIKEKNYLNENIPINNKSKKVQKLEKILKQIILKNDFNKTNQNQMYLDNFKENQDEDDYEGNEKYINRFNYNKNKTINNINNYPSLTPILKNNYNIQNTDERNSNILDNYMKNNNIQEYFKINSNTPNRFTVNGYEYLINKKRPKTPKLNEINLNRNTIPVNNRIINNEYKNKTSMEGFIRNNNLNINNDIKNSKEYETLEMQLQDMEQHLQNMALNRDIVPNSNNNYFSKTNRENNKLDINKYYNNDIHINNNYIDKKTKNQSMISNGSSYIDEQKNINTNMTNNIYNNSNNNYFNKYNSQNLNINNDDEGMEINRRIDNLEKNIVEIKDELNNLSSNIKIFLNQDNFLYNFKDSIKQICYEFFTERINLDNNEQIKNENENGNENEEKENSQNSGEYSEEKDMQNDNNKIEEEINKKIDEKLEYLCDNLKDQIYEKYLQPSINEIEKSMRQNIEDLKEKVDSINYTNNNNNSKQLKKNSYFTNSNIIGDDNNDIDNGSLQFKNKTEDINNSKDDIYHKTSSKTKKEKYEEINRLGEKLYGKLLEKEKKLKLLKQETMKNMENIK